MKKIRFGVVGTSTIVDNVLEGAFLDERFELCAVYSRKQETGEAFASKYGVKNVFTSLDEMTKSNIIDAVYIASPNAFHAEHSICAMNNKKHVICEKPFATSKEEVQKMIDCAKANNVALMEAMKPTLMPNFNVIKENIHKIGQIKRYFSSYVNISSRYQNYRKGIIENAFRPELVNGAIMDIGVYTIYPMVSLFGKPKTIQSTGVMLKSGVDGDGCAIFDYGDFSAIALFSKTCKSTIPTEIQGEDGTIIINQIGHISNVKLFDRETNTTTDISASHIGNGYYHEIKEFLDLIENDKLESSVNTWETSLAVMEIVENIRRNIWDN